MGQQIQRQTGRQTEEQIEKQIEACSRGYAEINLDHIIFNMKNMKDHLAPDTKMTAVIKADAYGHGAEAIARALEPYDFLYGFAVATAEEAHVLRKNGIEKPILILGYTFPYAYEQLIEEEIRPCVFTVETAKQLSECAARLKKKVKIHVKVDTGMGRIGITPDEEGLRIVEQMNNFDGIEIEGIFTHFARADEKDKTSAKAQLELFLSFIALTEERLGIRIPIRHCSNSAGILEMPEANLDMVRAGITMYGLYPSDEVSREIVELRPALSLISHIVYVKTLHAGQSISYGGTFTADHEMRVATIPLGYADGYPRSLSGKGQVLIRGKRVPVIGRVCMDQLMVDVSDLSDVKCAEKVTLIGFDGEEHISAEELGDISGRFNYELVCGLSARLPKVYILDKRPVMVKNHYDL